MKTSKLLSIWAIISIVVGIALCNIPWGDPEGFHGTGFPVAVVMWQHGIDYPNVFAFVLNPLLVFAVGGILILLWKVAARSNWMHFTILVAVALGVIVTVNVIRIRSAKAQNTLLDDLRLKNK